MTGPAFRRRDHMILGEVVENVDPEGLGRVRVLVSAILEPESLWCMPIGAMLGRKNGTHHVPEKGANVCVWLNQGDHDVPYYAPGPWGGGTLPEETENGNPEIDVFRWRDFVVVIDGRPGLEKVFFKDRTTTSQFMFDRTTGNFTRLVTGPQGDETATIKRNLVTTVQNGSETRTIAAGNRATTISGNDAKTLGGNETKTIGGGRTEAITGTEAKTIGGAATETITLGKVITALLAIALTAGTNIVLTAGGALNLIASSISLSSSGASSVASVGLMTQTLLGGIVQTVVGAIVVGVTGAVTETVSGLWTMVVTGGLLISGAVIQAGTGSNGGFRKLLTDHLIGFLNDHTHNVAGVESAKPTQQIVSGGTAPNYDLDKARTSDLTAS